MWRVFSTPGLCGSLSVVRFWFLQHVKSSHSQCSLRNILQSCSACLGVTPACLHGHACIHAHAVQMQSSLSRKLLLSWRHRANLVASAPYIYISCKQQAVVLVCKRHALQNSHVHGAGEMQMQMQASKHACSFHSCTPLHIQHRWALEAHFKDDTQSSIKPACMTCSCHEGFSHNCTDHHMPTVFAGLGRHAFASQEQS